MGKQTITQKIPEKVQAEKKPKVKHKDIPDTEGKIPEEKVRRKLPYKGRPDSLYLAYNICQAFEKVFPEKSYSGQARLRALEIPISNYYQWTKGQRNPQGRVLSALAVKLKTTVAELRCKPDNWEELKWEFYAARWPEEFESRDPVKYRETIEKIRLKPNIPYATSTNNEVSPREFDNLDEHSIMLIKKLGNINAVINSQDGSVDTKRHLQKLIDELTLDIAQAHYVNLSDFFKMLIETSIILGPTEFRDTLQEVKTFLNVKITSKQHQNKPQ